MVKDKMSSVNTAVGKVPQCIKNYVFFFFLFLRDTEQTYTWNIYPKRGTQTSMQIQKNHMHLIFMRHTPAERADLGMYYVIFLLGLTIYFMTICRMNRNQN